MEVFVETSQVALPRHEAWSNGCLRVVRVESELFTGTGAMKDRRYKIIRVTPELLVDLFKAPEPDAQYTVVWESHLPDDATFINACYDMKTETIELIIHSEAFDVVDEGRIIPLMEAATFNKEKV